MLPKRSAASLQSDVLKVGRHEQELNHSGFLAAALQPRLAVAPSGQGRFYGHASGHVIERLRPADDPTLRADTSGAIHILTDGKHREVLCFLDCPEIRAQINSAKPQTPQDQQSDQQQQITERRLVFVIFLILRERKLSASFALKRLLPQSIRRQK